MLNAFCRVAPSDRLRVFAILAARFFFFARVFNVRTCAVVQARRFDTFLAIQITPGFMNVSFVAESSCEEKPGEFRNVTPTKLCWSSLCGLLASESLRANGRWLIKAP